MTIADIFIATPLMLLAVGALLTLLLGAVTHNDKVGILIGVATTSAVALWLLQTPPVIVAPKLEISAAGLPRLFGFFFSTLAAGVLSLSSAYNRERWISGEEYPATVLFTTFGMLALASATNLLILFLGLEAMSFGFYILVAIDLKRTTSGETGLKYLLPGALSTAFMAFGIALLYCASGTLSIQETLHHTMTSIRPEPIALAGWGCFLVGIGFKLSLAPLHLWTPDVYQGAPPPVVAFLSGGSKAATILLLLLLLPHAADTSILRVPLWGLAFFSMLVGNLAALLQNNIKRLLGYSSIAQMGYVVIALLSGKGGGYVAAAYYAICYGVITLAAFGAVTVIERNGVGDTIEDYRGLGYKQPYAAVVLTLALFALAGIPTTVGFTGKFLIFTSAISSGEVFLAVTGILLAAVSIYYYLKVVVTLYFTHSENHEISNTTYPEYIVLSAASAAIIVLGLWPDVLINRLSQLLP